MTLQRYIVAGMVVLATACSRESITEPTDSASFAKGRGSAGTGSSNAARTELRIRLVAPADAPIAGAKGEARFRTRGLRTQFKAEVENVPAGSEYQVFVNGVQVGGTITADLLGQAELELESQHGDTVPVIVAGDAVEIRDLAGVVVVSGTF